jgi:hypothetical protein
MAELMPQFREISLTGGGIGLFESTDNLDLS